MNRHQQMQSLLEQEVANVVRKNFLAEVQALREAGRDVPDDDEAQRQFSVCFQSDNPKKDIAHLLNVYQHQPMKKSARTYAGRTMSRDERAGAHRAMGIQFSAEDIDFGLTIGKAIENAGR